MAIVKEFEQKLKLATKRFNEVFLKREKLNQQGPVVLSMRQLLDQERDRIKMLFPDGVDKYSVDRFLKEIDRTDEELDSRIHLGEDIDSERRARALDQAKASEIAKEREIALEQEQQLQWRKRFVSDKGTTNISANEKTGSSSGQSIKGKTDWELRQEELSERASKEQAEINRRHEEMHAKDRQRREQLAIEEAEKKKQQERERERLENERRQQEERRLQEEDQKRRERLEYERQLREAT